MDIRKKIITFSKDFYMKLDFAHNVEHGERVVHNALLINQFEGGDEFIVEMGAWLHQLHDNLEELNNFLNNLELDDKLKKELYQIVKLCRPRLIHDQASLEAKIVFDADAIEILGPYGVVREILCNYGVRKKGWDESIKDTIDVGKLFEEKIQTKTGLDIIKNDVELIRKFWEIYYTRYELNY